MATIVLGISPKYANFLSFLHQNLAKTCKKWEKQLLINDWSVQHPNAGQNIQQTILTLIIFTFSEWVPNTKTGPGGWGQPGRAFLSCNQVPIQLTVFYFNNIYFCENE